MHKKLIYAILSINILAIAYFQTLSNSLAVASNANMPTDTQASLPMLP